jgi:ribosomal-protein-alanine N-acetyltransferase
MDESLVFSQFPILVTERLVLRELREDDLAESHRIFSDPEAMRYVGKPPHTSLAETQLFLSRNQQLFPARSGVRWAITLAGDDRLIGSCGHWRLMKEHHRSEIGYDLLPEHWGKGIMTEALRAVLHFGFSRMGLHSTEAQIEPDNLRSRRVLEKLGFQRDGLIRENYFANGRYTDTEIFTLLAREFYGEE